MKKNITFGICISKDTPPDYLFRSLVGIYNMRDTMNHYEVILCGHASDAAYSVIATFSMQMRVSLISYEGPSDKPGHITKKKNLIVHYAQYDVTVLMHDYYWLPPDFTIAMPDKFDVYCAPIRTAEGTRHSDWMVNPRRMETFINETPDMWERLMTVNPAENAPWFINALPYHVSYLSPIMYVSGGLITARTEVLRDVPQNEDLYWGDAEDLEWSERLVAKYKLKTTSWNGAVGYATAMKPGKWAVTEIPLDIVKELKVHYGL